MKRQRALATLLALAIVATPAATTATTDSASTTDAPTSSWSAARPDRRATTESTAGALGRRHHDHGDRHRSGGLDVVAGEPFPEARCAANEAAGTISYLTGFDYAATASIIDVLVADAQGLLRRPLPRRRRSPPSFSTANYPLVAAERRPVLVGGLVQRARHRSPTANDADLVALAVEGRVAIDSLMVKPEIADDLDELAGTTIGVKGKLPPSIAAMLAEVGLVEGTDYRDRAARRLRPGRPLRDRAASSAFPARRATSPARSSGPASPFDLYDPADYGIPGSFGVIYTNRTFLDEHPTAARGLHAGHDARPRRRDRRSRRGGRRSPST